MKLLYIEFPRWLSPNVIPGLPIRWYGLMYLVAFAIAYLLIKYQVKKDQLDTAPDDAYNLFFWMILELCWVHGFSLYCSTIPAATTCSALGGLSGHLRAGDLSASRE